MQSLTISVLTAWTLLRHSQLGQLSIVRKCSDVQFADGSQVLHLCRGSPDRQRGMDCCALSQAGDPYDTGIAFACAMEELQVLSPVYLRHAEHAVLAAGRSDGSIELWQPCTGASLGTIAAPQASSAEQKEGRTLRGLAVCWSSSRQAFLHGFFQRPWLAISKRQEVPAVGAFPVPCGG